MDEASRKEFAEASAADVARYLDECEKVGVPPGPPGVTIEEIARPISAAQACGPAPASPPCACAPSAIHIGYVCMDSTLHVRGSCLRSSARL